MVVEKNFNEDPEDPQDPSEDWVQICAVVLLNGACLLHSLLIKSSTYTRLSHVDGSYEMLIFTRAILLGCLGQASALATRSPPNDTDSSLLLAPHNNSFTDLISAANLKGPTPPELYMKTEKVRDLQNASFTKGLVRFFNYNYSEGRYPASLIHDFLSNAFTFIGTEQQAERQGPDETIEDNYFLYSRADPTGGEIELIFQGVEGQQRETTWRDVTVVIGSLVVWVELWRKSSLFVPSTEIVLEVYDGQGYVVVSSGFMFTIKGASQSQPQDSQTS